MFKKILVPISSEFFPPAVFQISALLAQASHGTVTSIYIYEKKIFDEIERLSDTYLSHYDREETQREIRQEHLCQAEQIVFENAKAFFKKRDIPLQTTCKEGILDDIIKQEIAEKKYDLIVIGFEREYTFDYHLLSDVHIPIWIESGKGKKSILAVCSNLAPNKKVPLVSMQLASLLGWELHMTYIVDTEDTVEVDESGTRKEKKSLPELQQKAKHFMKNMKEKGIEVQLVTGTFEKETLRAASRIQPGLVVIGREQKQKGLLGFPVKDSKKKILEHCKCSLLFLN
jgi:nucleotide-binding universal stress UspA family protein